MHESSPYFTVSSDKSPVCPETPRAELGSLGRRRYMAALKRGENDYIAREAKALVPSALSWLEMRLAAISLAGTLLQRIVRSPDRAYRSTIAG